MVGRTARRSASDESGGQQSVESSVARQTGRRTPSAESCIVCETERRPSGVRRPTAATTGL